MHSGLRMQPIGSPTDSFPGVVDVVPYRTEHRLSVSSVSRRQRERPKARSRKAAARRRSCLPSAFKYQLFIGSAGAEVSLRTASHSGFDMLFVKGFDAGEPIVYISTDAGQPLSAVLERSTFVPALDQAAYNGGDDFLGSARERLFGFINGQTGADNGESQGFVHLAQDGHVSEDASADNTALIDALRCGGDLLNVFGDFPTLENPRHAHAYSPLWDAQLGLWTENAVQQGLNTRQIDEVEIFNLAATRPDLLTGVDPGTMEPVPYGSVGVDINCAVLGFTAKPPTANLADPLPDSQFPPR